MPSIDDVLSLYTRAMRSMHACIEPCIEKTLPIHARSYFMSGNMSAHVNLIRHMQIYAPSYTPGAYLVHKTHAHVCKTVHSVLRKHSHPFVSICGSGFMEFAL